MNTGEFLVTTVHEIAISTEFAITARPSQETHTDALTSRPALDARAKGVDPPDHLVPRDARPVDWEGAFHRAGIRVADTGRLDTNAHLTDARIDQRFHYGCKFSRFRYLDCSIHCAHVGSATLRPPLVGPLHGFRSSRRVASRSDRPSVQMSPPGKARVETGDEWYGRPGL